MREKNIYADRIIKCKRCLNVIGRTAFDSQILILENGLVLFNYACWYCPPPCNKYDSWLAPELPEENLSNLEKYPDAQTIERRAVRIRQNYKNSLPKSGFVGVKASNNKFVARINVSGKTRYLGSFDTPEDAHAEYLRAKATLTNE